MAYSLPFKIVRLWERIQVLLANNINGKYISISLLLWSSLWWISDINQKKQFKHIPDKSKQGKNDIIKISNFDNNLFVQNMSTIRSVINLIIHQMSIHPYIRFCQFFDSISIKLSGIFRVILIKELNFLIEFRLIFM